MSSLEYTTLGFLLGCVFSWVTALLAISVYKNEVKS